MLSESTVLIYLDVIICFSFKQQVCLLEETLFSFGNCAHFLNSSGGA